MSSIPPHLESWLLIVIDPEELTTPLYKRPQYRRHKDQIPKLESIFRSLAQPHPRGGVAALSEVTGVADSTLRTWEKKVRKDPHWRPSRQAYAIPQRIFTDEEEQTLLDYVIANYLDKGLYYSDSDFKLDCLKFYYKIKADATHPPSDFRASRHFVQDFR
jgi:hypothetical protein